MTRTQWIILLVSGISSGAAVMGCAPGGVGDPCIPEDEYTAYFPGFGATEANVESRSFQCETRVCIVNHFQGRVSCPYGQSSDDSGQLIPSAAGQCYVPSSSTPVTIAVQPQLLERRADSTVYCSCRCEGADKTAKYCSCPSGYSCSQLVPDIGIGKVNLAGKYCLKNGTEFTTLKGGTCDAQTKSCDTPGNPAGKNPAP